MGNSTALPYDIQESVEYRSNNFWTLSQGSTKADKEAGKTPVSIFKFLKANRTDRLPLAQRNVQKLRTLRHPYVLTYVDSIEVEDSVLLVTESCVPLERRLSEMTQQENNPNARNARTNSLVYELTWGFKCVLKALDFLHTQAGILHGNLDLSAIFVTANGDWKLGAFDVASALLQGGDEEVLFFTQHHNLLDTVFQAPERRTLPSQSQLVLRGGGKLPHGLDLFSWATALHTAFQRCQASATSLSKFTALCLSDEPKKRPSAAKLLTASPFTSPYIKSLESLQEFALRTSKQVGDILRHELAADTKDSNEEGLLLPHLTTGLVMHRLLPAVTKVMLLAAQEEYSVRDSRESVRQTLVTYIELLGKLCVLQKIDVAVFQTQTLPHSPNSTSGTPQGGATHSGDLALNANLSLLLLLFSLTDRTIRSALLAQMKHLAALFPTTALQRSALFDHLLAGFNDSQPKLREATLMACLHVIDRLDDSQLHDRLLRAVMNLQQDAEPSIRTNCMIFLGKICGKLKEGVRQKMLPVACVKSMKDVFLHCRLAGLKTSVACIDFFDLSSLATKILPQAAALVLDKQSDVRSLSLNLLDCCLVRLRVHHNEQVALLAQSQSQQTQPEKSQSQGDKDRDRDAKKSSSASASTATGTAESSAASTWSTGWSLVSGLTGSTNKDDEQSAGGSSRIGELKIDREKLRAMTLSNTTTPVRRDTGTAEEDDDNDIDNFFETKNMPAGPAISKPTSKVSSSSGWADEDLDDALFDDHKNSTNNDFDEDWDASGENTPASATASASTRGGAGAVSSMKLSVGSSSSLKTSSLNTGNSGNSAQQLLVTPSVSVGSASARRSSAAAGSGSMKLSTAGDKEKDKDKKTATKVAVKKLEFSNKDDWDDF